MALTPFEVKFTALSAALHWHGVDKSSPYFAM
jgi:hypothetical protein